MKVVKRPKVGVDSALGDLVDAHAASVAAEPAAVEPEAPARVAEPAAEPPADVAIQAEPTPTEAEPAEAVTVKTLTAPRQRRVLSNYRMPVAILEELAKLDAAVEGLTMTDVVVRGTAAEVMRLRREYERKTGREVPPLPEKVQL